MRNVAWLGLEQEEEVAISLCLIVVRKEALLKLCAIFEVTRNLILLLYVSRCVHLGVLTQPTSSNAMRF